MPPAPARNTFVILFDMKTQSRTAALNALSKILLFKRLSQTKDEYKLYLVNVGRQSNKLPEGLFFLDINDKVETVLGEIEAIETGDTNWLEALNVAINELKEWYEKPGIITLQILFITDLSSFDSPDDGKLLNSVINDLRSYDMFLYVIGPDIQPLNIILSAEEIKEWMKNVIVDETNSNLKLMRKIVTKTPNSVMCNYDIGVNLFNSFDYRKGMQPWQVPLTFGTILSLPVSTIRMTKVEAPFKLKSTASRNSGEMKWVYADQEDVELHFSDTVGGLVRHGKFVKIETDGLFKVEGPRSFSVLGFTSVECIPEYLLQSDGSYLVIPDQNQPKEYLEFFSALVDELEESNKYIIVRRVYNKDYNPKFGVLIPKTDLSIKGFILCELPYADDIAHICMHAYVHNAQDIQKVPKIEKNKDIYNFLDNLNVSNEDCKHKVPLAPAMMVDPNSLNIIKKVEEKTNEERLLQKIDTTNIDIQNLDNLKNEWPVRELLKVKKEENTADDFDEIGDFDFS